MKLSKILDNLGNYTPFKTYIYNKDKHNSNILFITGHSGVGKSTLARKIARKWDAKVFEIDAIIKYHSLNPISIEYRVVSKCIKKLGLEGKDTRVLSDRQLGKLEFVVIEYILSGKSEYGEHNIIIEGSQVVTESIYWNRQFSDMYISYPIVELFRRISDSERDAYDRDVVGKDISYIDYRNKRGHLHYSYRAGLINFRKIMQKK